MASIVLVNNESIWDTELCSAFHASCSLVVAPLAPAWSPGVEWNSWGLVSSNSFRAYKFFWAVMYTFS